MNKEIWSYIYAKYDGMSRNTYDANWGGRCNIYVINNISFKTYHDNVVDIFIDNKSLLDKYKGDFIKSLNLLDIERPVKIYMKNNENEKYLTIDYEKVNFYTNDALLLDNFRYKDKNIFEEILYLQPDFLKEEFEIMKENGVDLNYLFEEQKLNNEKFKNFIESSDNELIIKIANHYYKIYKEFHPELTETYSVCKTEILKNSYDNTINEYIASFTKDNLLLRTSEKEKYFDLEKLNKKEIYIDLQNEVSKKCYDYFKEYGKNIIENTVQDRFEVYERAAKRRNLNVLDYINCYINNINVDSIEQAKETIKNNFIKEIKAAYQNDNHYELPNVVVKKQYLTKDILSLYFEDKDKCIDTILDFVKEEYKEGFNVYYSYEYVDKNQDALMKIKNDLIKLVDDYSIKSCNVELEFPDKSKVEFKFNMPQNRINYIKQQIINYDVLAIKTRHSYVKYPVESIKKITRYKQVLFDRNNYDAINYDKKQLIDIYSKCNIYTHFSNDFYEDKDIVKKLLYKQSSIISNLNEKLLMDEDFIEYLIRSYSHKLSLISCYTPEMVDKFIEVAKKENLAFNTIDPFLNVPGFELTNDKIKELFNISKQPEIDAEKILCKIPEAKFKDKDFINFLKNEKIIPLKPDYGHKFFDYIKDIDILFDVLHIKGMFNKVIHAPKFLNDEEFMNYLLERADFEKINLKTNQILPIYQDDKDIIYKAAKVCDGEYCQEFYDSLINIENEKKAARTPCAFELNEDMQIELMDSNINFIKNRCINQNVKDIYIIGTMCGFNKIYKDAYSIFLETDQFKIIINKNHFVITDDKERVYTSPIDCDNINMIIDALIDEMHDREMSVKATNFESLLKELPDRSSLEKEI